MLAICVVIVCTTWIVSAENQTEQEPAWAKPSAKTIKRVAAVPNAQHDFNLLNNMDCQLITYRLVNSSDMRSGCFTPTAFGLMDISGSIVIFNGTDEGVPITSKATGSILVPWPNASTLIVLDSVVTGGSYISLYSSPLAQMTDQRTGPLLTSKRMSSPPDIQLKDNTGERLIINTQTLAMSDGGSWLVAETYSGSFVRINLATLDTKLFAPAYPTGGLASRVAVSDDGRYVSILNKNYDHFKVFDLSNCTGNTCASYNYYSLLSSQVSNISALRHLRFVNRGLLSFEVSSSTNGQSGIYQLAPRSSIDSMTDYIGLGDSYTSGEGAFDYRDGTDTEENSCHLSIHSYPMLLVKDLFTSSGGHSVACSGARIHDIGNSSGTYKGQTSNSLSLNELVQGNASLLESVESNYIPGYVAQQRFVKRWQPKTVTVSIGGNDIGFGEILKQCVMPKVSRHHSDSVCFNTYEDRVEVKNLIDRTIPRWTALFKQLRSESSTTQFYAIGYPDVIDDTGSCAINVNLNKSELEFAKELLVYLNQGIQKAANSASVSYVDITQALVGHRLCETKSHNVAVNGLTTGRDTFIFGSESYHPNALGHQLVEQEILQKTNNLRSGASESTQHASSLLNAPKSGRTITNKIYAAFTNEVQYSGTNSTIRLSGSLLKPNTPYIVSIGNQNVGTLSSDVEGNLQSNISIPVLPSGPSTIVIIGDGPSNQHTEVTQPIYIPDTPADIDGDGVPNEADSCRTAVNSDQDVDQDGIDDVCDPLIDEPPEQSSEPETIKPTPDTLTTVPSNSIIPLPIDEKVEGMVLTKPEVTIISSLKMGGERSAIKSTSGKIYHGQGVGVNNVGSNNSVLGVKKSADKGSERIRYTNPWVLWWIYLLFLPLVLWLFARGTYWAKQQVSGS